MLLTANRSRLLVDRHTKCAFNTWTMFCAPVIGQCGGGWMGALYLWKRYESVTNLRFEYDTPL